MYRKLKNFFNLIGKHPTPKVTSSHLQHKHKLYYKSTCLQSQVLLHLLLIITMPLRQRHSARSYRLARLMIGAAKASASAFRGCSTTSATSASSPSSRTSAGATSSGWIPFESSPRTRTRSPTSGLTSTSRRGALTSAILRQWQLLSI